MKTILVYDDTEKELTELSEKEDLTIAELIDEALDLLLQSRR